MAVELEKYLRKVLQTLSPDHPDKLFVSRLLKETRAHNLSACGQPVLETETDIQNEWQRQAKKLATLFAEELRMTDEEYIASLPQITFPPEEIRVRFNLPIIVETRIPLERLCEIVGIERESLSDNDVLDWPDDPQGYRTPETPYITWTHDGRPNFDKSMMNVRAELEVDERGATAFDGIALYIAHPEILKDHFLDLPGSQFMFMPSGAPTLSIMDDQPKLAPDWIDFPYSRTGSVVCWRD